MKWILLPGMDGTGELFKPLIEVLPPSISSIVIRYPVDKFLNYDELTQHTRKEIPEEPHLLVAESFSGPVAAALANSTSQIKGVIFAASFVSPPIGVMKKFVVSTCQKFLFQRTPPTWAIKSFLLGDDCPESMLADFYKAISQVDPKVMQQRLDLILQCNAGSEFNKIRVPIFYLQGSKDQLVSKAACLHMQKLQPKMIIQELDSPHMLFQRNPKDAFSLIQEFEKTL